jgi:7-cyano-7-deazaguanine reductase
MSEQIDEIELAKTELGKKAVYDFHYNPKKLFPVTRAGRRAEIGIHEKLPFFGYDLWNHYEVSWLNEKGKPIVGIAEVVYGCDTPCLIESKSMKLYFNSFNNTPFNDVKAVEAALTKDLTEKTGAPVEVNVTTVNAFKEEKVVRGFSGTNLDELDIACTVYMVDPSLLKTEGEVVEETLCSDLLKSNCLVTGQPDWGSIQITYKGKKINHESLLRYIVSFRDHTEFGEHCIERIFMNLLNYCKPEELTIYISYTRRGGLDINFARSTKPVKREKQSRICRQ